MRVRWTGAVVLAASTCVPGCDIGPDFSGLGDPITLPTRPCLEASEWRIASFSLTVTSDGSAFLLPLGHSRRLSTYPLGGISVDCDEAVVSARWISTRPDVAEFSEASGPPTWAWLTGRTLGEASVSAEVALSDGRTITAPLIAGVDELPVRVVPALDPSVGQTILLEGTVDLEAENNGRNPSARAYLVFDVPAPGTVNMWVDWESVSNRITAHLCPGETSSGCSPIIDGTQLWGQKPMSASKETSPGAHTLWITNGGPGPETVRYQMGLTPD